ncbi:hypothetical protein J7E25_00290 [Agromyces sp. ISL-38]|uniref:hypothetical protein n=1 Tax=Agromyces sp. ISL-38 TaxID=2819107 RepID=UPI001BE70E88|nr:hypothetical protein [Agromyces sp. ISL-38]MBT2497530.1 hypothetical protein [Agromyces sp. ISL-38]
MNRKTAAAAVITASLAVLLSGCAGAAAQSQVNDDLKPLANSVAIGLARGRVIVKDDLSPTRPQTIAQQADASRPWSADERREFHAQSVLSVTVEQPFSAEVWRELKGTAPATVEHPFSDAAKRELKGTAPATVEHPFSDAAKRELKGSAPVAVSAADMQGTRLSAFAEAYAAVAVHDDLSPLRDGTRPAPTPDTVDDDLSPLGGDR